MSHSLNTEKNVKRKFLLLMIVLVGFISSIIQIYHPLIAEGDAYSRVNVANDQHEINLFFNKYGGTWLPFHFSFMVLALSVIDNIHFIPRLITAILSTGSILGIYFYTLEFTKNKTIATVSSILYLLFPLRYFLSSQPLSEPIFSFFILFGIFYIAKDKLKKSDAILSSIFINIAHGIRYESWFLLPIIIIFVAIKKVSLIQKIGYLLSVFTFPMLWIYLNYKYQGNALMFFNQKYDVAQSYIVPQYFNLKLSFSAWNEKLIPIFPLSYIFLSLPGFFKMIKDLNQKKLLFYILPIYFYFLLILQVFLGTMEWFPSRYLLIPTTFLIPVLAEGMVIVYKNLSQYIKAQKAQFNHNLLSIIFFILFFVFRDYSASYKFTHLETNDWSLLEAYNTYQTIYESERYVHLTEIIAQCKLHCNPSGQIFFFYPETGRTYLDQAIFYFLKRHGRDYSQKDSTNHLKSGAVFIWEKSLDPVANNSHIINNNQEFETLFENERFYLLRMK